MLTKKKIVIDAGHGGSDPGAVNRAGLGTFEKTVVLPVVLEVEPMLSAYDAEIILTRRTDVFVPRPRRINIANANRAIAYVTVHANGFTKPTAHGTECWHRPGDNLGKELAQKLQANLLIALGRRDRGVKKGVFEVMRGAVMPTALVELAFITNNTEERLLLNKAYQILAAKAISNAIVDFCELELKDNTKGYFIHIVQKGETLGSIGLLHNVPWRFLASFNNLENPHNIIAGQVIKIPHEEEKTSDLSDIKTLYEAGIFTKAQVEQPYAKVTNTDLAHVVTELIRYGGEE